MSNDYEIGFGKPPQHSKWQPGRSGNPAGRPKGSKNLATIMRGILSHKVGVTENGQTRRVPYVEAFAQSLAAKGLHGTARDQIALMKALHDYMPEALKPEEPTERQTMTIQFVSAKDGKPYYPEEEATAPENNEVSESTEISETSHTTGQESDTAGNLDDDALEAAWKASGIADEPETESDPSSSTS